MIVCAKHALACRRQNLRKVQFAKIAAVLEPQEDAVIPEDVRRFIFTAVPSIPYLEAMLLFFRAPDVQRSAVEVARSLYLPERRAMELIEQLHEIGIVAREGDARFRYAPRDPSLASAVERLAEVYADDIIGVTHLVHDAMGKSAQRFADAFKLRKDH